MNAPQISIVTVNLNDRSGLRVTLDSLVRQTYQQYELLVIDGDSIDGSAKFAQTFSNVTTVISEPDDGIYYAMNKGLRLARGSYVLFLNSGDALVDETCLFDAARYCMEKENADKLLFLRAVVVDGDRIAWMSPPESVDQSNWTEWVSGRRLPNHQCTLYPRSYYSKHGFDEDLQVFSDSDYTLKALSLGFPMVFIDKQFAVFQLGGVSSIPGSLRKAMKLAEESTELAIRYQPKTSRFFVSKAYMRFIAKWAMYKMLGRNLHFRLLSLRNSRCRLN